MEYNDIEKLIKTECDKDIGTLDEQKILNYALSASADGAKTPRRAASPAGGRQTRANGNAVTGQGTSVRNRVIAGVVAAVLLIGIVLGSLAIFTDLFKPGSGSVVYNHTAYKSMTVATKVNSPKQNDIEKSSFTESAYRPNISAQNSGKLNISDIVTSQESDGSYYAVAGQDVFIVIDLNNPTNYGVFRFTLNGKQYEVLDLAYTNSTNNTLVLNVGTLAAGTSTFTLDKVTYLTDENKIVDYMINKTVTATVHGWERVDFYSPLTHGDDAAESIEVVNGQSITQSPELTKDGYHFGGWKNRETGEFFDIETGIVTAPLALNAVWYVRPAIQEYADELLTFTYLDNIAVNLWSELADNTISYSIAEYSVMPDWLELKSGVLVGKAGRVGSYHLTIVARSSMYNKTAEKDIVITVNKANPLIDEWPTAAGLERFDSAGLKNSAPLSSILTGGKANAEGSFVWAQHNSAGCGEIYDMIEDRHPDVLGGFYVEFIPTDTVNYNTVTAAQKTTISLEKRTVSFNANYEEAPTIADLIIAKGGTAQGRLPNPARRSLYAFTGWYNDKDCLSPFDDSTRIDSNITLYAGWIESEEPNEFIMEAECTDLTGKSGNGYSGHAVEDDMIVQSNAASGGYFVGYMYSNQLSLEFYFTSDMARNDASIVARFAAEFTNISFNPDMVDISLNGTSLKYGQISIDYSLDLNFHEYTIGTSLPLLEGANSLVLTVTNTEPILDGTMFSTAPVIDCFKIYTAAVLAWDSTRGLPKNYTT